MSIVKLNRNNFATKSVNLSTQRQFISSSMGVTGALKVIVDRSNTQKDNIDDRVGLTGENTPQPFGENTFEGRREIIMRFLSGQDLDPEDPAYVPSFLDTNNGELELAQLLDGSGVHAGAIPPEYEKYGFSAADDPFTETGYSDISMHPRNSTELLVRALKPESSMFASGSMALTMAEKILEPYHRVRNSMIGSKYVNFNCMNFFDADDTMALLYHGSSTPNGNNAYVIDDDFSVEFWIKINPSTNRGTIIHQKGIFSVAVVPNTTLDHMNNPINYALGFAYGRVRSTDVSDKPSSINYGTHSNTKLTNYFLEHDVWTHCAITVKFSTTKETSEILVYKNGKVQSAIQDTTSGLTYDNIHHLIALGAYYFDHSSKVSAQAGQGLGLSDTHMNLDPTKVVDGLNANLHEVRVWKKTISKKDINDFLYKTYSGSVADHAQRQIIFYVPCLYDVDFRSIPTHSVAPALISSTELDQVHQPVGFRQIYNADTTTSRKSAVINIGSIPSNFNSIADIYNTQTAVHKRSSAAPYNTNHANIGNFANINIQSFLKDYANMEFPFCHHLSESLGDRLSLSSAFRSNEPNSAFATIHDLTSSFSTIKGHQARNCFILPCDNGNFRPDYKTLFHATGSKFLQNDGFFINTKDIGDLNDILDSKLFFIDDVFAARESFAVESISRHTTQGGDTRYNSGIDLFAVLDEDPLDSDIPNFQLPEVNDPNFTSIFEASDFPGPLTTIITIPQLYYGNRIKPGSIRIRSNLYAGTKSHIELRDNGEGVLYRHQTSGSVANWNKVGDVYYGEGLIYVRNPSLYALSDSDIDVEFKSENKVNVLETNVFCKAGLVNSSSNPNHVKMPPTSDENEAAEEFVYISTVYLHDDNLNVVAKAKLAQPIVKRSENKFLFRLKVDF